MFNVFTSMTYQSVAGNSDLVHQMENIQQLLRTLDTCWRLLLCQQLTVVTLQRQRTRQICRRLRYYADAVIITSADILTEPRGSSQGRILR